MTKNILSKIIFLLSLISFSYSLFGKQYNGKYFYSKIFKKNSEKKSEKINNELLKLEDIEKKDINFASSSIPPFKTVRVINYFNLQYYAKIFIGTLKTAMTVILDTGSNLLWIPSTNCTNCRNYTNKYDPSTSNSSVITNIVKNITYAKGYVSGVFAEDLVSLSPNDSTTDIPGMRMLLVDEEADLLGTIADGILGLGIDTEGNNRNSLIYSLYEQGSITSPQFTFFLTDSRLLSRLYIGDVYQNAYLRNIIKNTNYTHECFIEKGSKYWGCNMTEISLEMTVVDKPKLGKNGVPDSVSTFNKVFYNSNSTAIFDSGTSYIIAPYSDFLNLVAYLKAHNNNTGNCALAEENQLVCQCSSPKEFGVMNLHFDNENYFTIRFKDIIDYFPSEPYSCRFELFVMDTIDFWILGDSALRGNLITYDFEQKRVQWTSTKGVFYGNKVDEASNVDTTNTIYYAWVVAAAAFIALLIFLAYCFMR